MHSGGGADRAPGESTLYKAGPAYSRRSPRREALFAAASLAAFGVLAASYAPAHAAAATAAAKAADEGTAVEEVVITGSRVSRVGFVAPTPVTAVSIEQIKNLNPGSLNDALRQLPILINSAGPRGATGSQGAGGSFLNLRRLGGARTLTLLDGRRFVPTTQAGSVDTALFPEALIQRVDIVTGGASAAYGSDAVAGVVNFVLDKKLTGFRGEAMYGIVEGGYAPEYKLSLAGGRAFGGGRGHLLVSAEYYQNKGLHSIEDIAEQDAFKKNCSVIQSPGGPTARAFACDVRVSTETNNGVILAGPLARTNLDASGNPTPFNPGVLNSAANQVGGDGAISNWQSYIVGNKRSSVFTRLSWDLTDSISGYLEGSYGGTIYQYPVGTHSQWQGNTALTIRADNPYLTPALSQRVAAAGVQSFRLGRYNFDLGRPWLTQQNNTTRFVGGFEGETAGFKWSTYYQYGKNRISQRVENVLNQDTSDLAVDAVRAPDGRIVCRSTLTNPNNGCVPVNLMGSRIYTDQQRAYIMGTSAQRGYLKQEVYAGEFSKDILVLPAGPVSLAGGAEHRLERIETTADADSKAISTYTGLPGKHQVGNYNDQRGEVSVNEAFLETVVPLLKDSPIAKELEFNGAARRTDYSTSGGVTTWKAGLTWRPVEALRLRATRSRDIRAPNLTELYNAGGGGRGNLNDQSFNPPRTALGVLTINRGNPALEPEIGDTLTFGGVFSPPFIRNLDISVDLYDIDLAGAIATPSATQTTLDCRNGSASACAQIIRDANGNAIQVFVQPVNLSRLKASGADVEVAYRFNLDAIGSPVPGDVSLRFLGTYVDKSYTVAPGAAIVDRTGDSSQPRWRWTLNVGYRHGPLNLSTQLRYTGKGPYDSTTLATDLPQREIPGQVLVNANVDYTLNSLGGEYVLYFNVANVFDQTAPIFGDGSNFDTIGRTFRGGVRVRY